MTASPRTWIVTGASGGLGHALAQHALDRGDHVAATSRRGTTGLRPGPGRLIELTLDVTDADQVTSAVATAEAELGHVDVLVNNAGHGLLGAVEETSPAEIEAVFATNVFGLLAVTRTVLPGMRARRSGHVVNIGSMGGFAQVAGWGVYGATKFALEGLSEALHAELAPLGIGVTVVEPGGFRTGFLDSVHTTATQLPDYATTAGVVRDAVLSGSVEQANSVELGAAALFAAITSPHPPTRLQLGPDAVAFVEAKLDHVRRELEEWRELATSTVDVPA